MGLLGVWNRTFLKLPTLAVLPYDQRLARLPAYLQQLEMESNGKSVSLDGEHVDFATAPIVWGEPGSNAQHSFFQMLHQGTLTAALDFIAPLRGSWGGTEGQDLALKNCFAQSQAFAFGHTRRGGRERRCARPGAAPEEIDRHRSRTGCTRATGRVRCCCIRRPRRAPWAGSAGAVRAQRVRAGHASGAINSFDQFGVELGKKLAVGIDMTGRQGADGAGSGGGCAALIEYREGAERRAVDSVSAIPIIAPP